MKKITTHEYEEKQKLFNVNYIIVSEGVTMVMKKCPFWGSQWERAMKMNYNVQRIYWLVVLFFAWIAL